MCKDNYRNEIQRVLAKQMTQDTVTIEDGLAATHLLACSYRDSGNIEASYESLKEIIEITLRVFGEDYGLISSLVLEAVFSLAIIANNTGHPEEAFGWPKCVDQGIENGAIERSLIEFNTQ
jgi:hypothetical protein